MSLPPGDYRVRHAVEYGNSGEVRFTVGLPVAVAAVFAQPSYPAGPVELPWALSNASSFPASFGVELSLERDGATVAGWSEEVWLGEVGCGREGYTGVQG